jgi:Thiolase, N-terminal domain
MLIADRFGRECGNLVFGWVFAGHHLGAATAAFGAALSRTLVCGYPPAAVVGALCIIATSGRARAQPTRACAGSRLTSITPVGSLMTNTDRIVILAAARTPLGRFQGELAPLTAPKLGAAVFRAALERATLAPERVDEVLMGCVLPAGQGQAPARQAARGAGLPDATGATTVNKVCGSARKATMLAHDLIAAGSAGIVLAGGMESMSNAP